MLARLGFAVVDQARPDILLLVEDGRIAADGSFDEVVHAYLD